MAKKKEKKQPKAKEAEAEAPQGRKTVVDPYTGEKEYPIENADKFIEVIPEDTGDRTGEGYLLNEESSMDHYTANENTDAVAEQMASYTENEEVEADFAERQGLASGGRKVLEEELDEHNSRSPVLTGGDIDASWSDQAGEETVGGSVATPDQDRVDELGEAAGLTYQDDEPLDYNKIRERDEKRWELNPASSLEQNQELEDVLKDIEEDEKKHSADTKKTDTKE